MSTKNKSAKIRYSAQIIELHQKIDKTKAAPKRELLPIYTNSNI